MGIENEEEARGSVVSGTSETTNLVADGNVNINQYISILGLFH